MYIQIVKTPPGRAPEHIRRMWVGIVLPSEGREANPASKEFRIGDENRGGYLVTGPDALGKLVLHNREAYDYWCETFPYLAFGGRLVFAADVCQEVII